MKTLIIVLITIASTLLIVFLVLNLGMGDKQVDSRVKSLYSTSDPQFIRTMGVMLGPEMVSGNRVDTLVNGDEIFPAMLAAIRGAKRSITFESYIYWSGTIGERFVEALAERARAGVKVHVMLDWAGSDKIDQSYLATMERSGVNIQRYHPVRWYTFGKLNNRTHRKLLIADGTVGFTGGVGIADEWAGKAQDPDHWRDTHFRVEGPVVAQLQSAFMDNWVEITGDVLHGEEYFPEINAVGDKLAQMFMSSPGGGSQSMQLMYLLSIAAATRSIELSAAYFVPDELSVRTFVAARKRGVSVRMVLPGPHIDTKIVRRASRSHWGELLKAGVEIYEYQPTNYHCKVMVVDGIWTSVGSTNFDSRSFSINDEANLNVYDADLAAQQHKVFQEDLKVSRKITLQEWENRPLKEKFGDWMAGLMGSQL